MESIQKKIDMINLRLLVIMGLSMILILCGIDLYNNLKAGGIFGEETPKPGTNIGVDDKIGQKSRDFLSKFKFSGESMAFLLNFLHVVIIFACTVIM